MNGSRAKKARLMTDEAAYYAKVGAEFAEHGVVHQEALRMLGRHDTLPPPDALPEKAPAANDDA